MDQNVNKYRIQLRSKKWWWPLFAYCVDLSVQQSWHLIRATSGAKEPELLDQTQAGRKGELDLLAVRRSIARVYLARTSRTKPGRPQNFNLSLDKRVSLDVRFDKTDHLIEPWNTQLRCAACGMKTKHRFSKCKVGVHDRCFIHYHTK